MKNKGIIYQKSKIYSIFNKFGIKIIFSYVILVVFLTVFFIIFGLRTSDNFGNGFIYGALCLVLFGILTLFGNTIPDQLSKLSLPKYRPPSTEPKRATELDGLTKRNRGKELFLTSWICGVLLFITGLILKAF